MDNQNKPKMPADDSWFDELLTEPQVGQELGADEQAVNAAGLTDPVDLELEQIILETQNMDVPPLETSELADELAQLEFAEELLVETVEELPVESAQEQPIEIVDDVPSGATDETLLNVPAAPAEASMDATMVHTIDPSDSSRIPEELKEASDFERISSYNRKGLFEDFNMTVDGRNVTFSFEGIKAYPSDYDYDDIAAIISSLE